VFHNLLRSEFTGAVYPVNPHAPVVQAVKAYRTVEEIPDEVDLAVLVVPAAQVPDTLEGCGRKGVRGVVVISAGFAETGAEGQALQARVVDILRRHGMRMVGPNCLGIVNADPEIRLNATFAPTFPPFGNVAFASQSGALGLAILDHAKELGVGISSFVSIGNKADVAAATTCMAHWADGPGDLGDPAVPGEPRGSRLLPRDRPPRRPQEAHRRGEERPHGGRSPRGQLAHRLPRRHGRRRGRPARARPA
jgi:predicted CoA-binding protein